MKIYVWPLNLLFTEKKSTFCFLILANTVSVKVFRTLRVTLNKAFYSNINTLALVRNVGNRCLNSAQVYALTEGREKSSHSLCVSSLSQTHPSMKIPSQGERRWGPESTHTCTHPLNNKRTHCQIPTKALYPYHNHFHNYSHEWFTCLRRTGRCFIFFVVFFNGPSDTQTSRLP